MNEAHTLTDTNWRSHFEQSGAIYKNQEGKLCRSSEVKLTITIDFNPLVDDISKVNSYVVSQLEKTHKLINSQLIKT